MEGPDTLPTTQPGGGGRGPRVRLVAEAVVVCVASGTRDTASFRELTSPLAALSCVLR